MSSTKTSAKKAVTTDAILNGNNKASTNKVRKSVNNPKTTAKQLAAQKQLKLEQQLAAIKQELTEAKKANKGTKPVIYLRDGITGKDLTRANKGAKQVISSHLHSLSFCLNTIKKFINKDGQIWNIETKQFDKVPALTSMFPTAKVKDIIPANVLRFRTEKQLERAKEQIEKLGTERFTIATVLNWLTQYYKARNGYIKPQSKAVTELEKHLENQSVSYIKPQSKAITK
jgi:hypothetical protein